MFEHHLPVLSRVRFIKRLSVHSLGAAALVAASVYGGIRGYREFEGLSWTDALLNAAMILGGMGPVDELHTEGGKLFAAAYALYSGVVFITTTGILLASFAHRSLHHLHQENKQ